MVDTSRTKGIHVSRPDYKPTDVAANRRELLEKKAAFEKKLQDQMVPSLQSKLDDVTGKMAQIEAQAQTNNEVVKAAWAALRSGTRAYDDARYTLPEMGSLRQYRDVAKAKLAELKRRQTLGTATALEVRETETIRAEIKRLGDEMFKIESEARTNSAALMQAVAAFQKAEQDYTASLLALSDYKELDVKRQELMGTLDAFVERQAGMSRQEK